MIENIKRVLLIIMKIVKKKDNKNAWQQIIYPSNSFTISWKLLGFIPFRIIFLITIILIEIFSIMFLSEIFRNDLVQILFLVLLVYCIFHTIKYYKKIMNKLQHSGNSWIEQDLIYLVNSLKLYDEETVEIQSSDGKIRKERRIIRTIIIFYLETEDNKLYVRILKTGDRFVKLSAELGENISSALGLEMEYINNSNVDYCEYCFLKHKEEIKQFVFSNSYPLDRTFFENVPLDIIRLSNTQSFSLKKNTNLGIYGRTGSGKTIALEYYLFSAVAKGCGIFTDSFLSIVDGKGADLFALGEILQQELGENVSIGQTPNSLAKLSREFVQIMNNRFEQIKNSNTLNADGYDLGMTPNFLFVDELASIRDSCGSSKQGKELWNEILQNLGLIARKGRQASCHLVIATQDPNSENIPVEIRSQISSVLYLGSPSNDRLKMGFSMCELANIPTISGRKGEALFYADGNNNMVEPELTIVPFVDVKTKQDFIDVIRKIKPIS